MRTIVKLAVTSLIAAAGFAAVADDMADVKKAIQSSMDQYCRLVLKKDLHGANNVVRSVVAKDAVIIGADGKQQSIDAWLKSMNANMQAMKSISKISMTLEKVTMKGKQAFGAEKFHMEGTVPSMADPKKTSKLVVQVTSDSIYEKRGGKWYVVKSVDKTSSMTLDGKPFDPAAAGHEGHKH